MTKLFKNKQEKGITLIALVVTIIVLLILAGISIAMLTGQNSILNRAGEAKIKTEKESAREQIGLEVLGSFSKYGDIDLNNLKTKLSNLNADVSNMDDVMEDDALTGKITLNGYDFYVDSNNNVLDYSGPVGTDTPEKSTTTTILDRSNGRIDIVFLNGTGYSVTETPNKPALDNTMVPVYYDTTVTPAVWKVCSDTDIDTWYKYQAADVSKAGTAEGDTKQSRWANVMLTDNIVVQKDGTTYDTEAIKTKLTENKLSDLVGATVTTEGSMLVWIPRYAYRITYYGESAKTTIKGYSDSRGIVDKDGKTPSDMQTPTTSINVNGTIGTTNYEYYRPHPAFEVDKDQGGWGKKITGIWVGKFEATGTTGAVTTLSNTVALKNKKIGELWNSLQNIKAGTKGSHMMKNSEWGAISYLAESKFGRNEVAITRNENSSYYTGDGDYKNNEKQKQSTTGNIYGVYDTVGGTYEYVASYIANEKNTNGYQFASTDGASTTNNNKTESTPYATVYQYNSTSDKDTNNYALSLNKIFGDGICETSTAGNRTTWHSASSSFASSWYPFFVRGGHYYNSIAGSFGFLGSNGNSGDSGSRVVCVVK